HPWCQNDEGGSTTGDVQPPANGGGTSTVPPSVRTTVSCARPPTGSPSTTNVDRSITRASASPCADRAAASASARVSASYSSSATPAAAFAAAQKRNVPRATSDTHQLGQVPAESIQQLRS